VTGGAPLTAPWKTVDPAAAVGTAVFEFTDPASGTMTYSINGVVASRKITRQPY